MFACAGQLIVTTTIQAVKLPTTTVTRLPFPFDENELELWNVEFWRLKKTFVKTLQIGLYSVFLNVPINPLSANPTKWSNTLKQFVGKSRRIV